MKPFSKFKHFIFIIVAISLTFVSCDCAQVALHELEDREHCLTAMAALEEAKGAMDEELRQVQMLQAVNCVDATEQSLGSMNPVDYIVSAFYSAPITLEAKKKKKKGKKKKNKKKNKKKKKSDKPVPSQATLDQFTQLVFGLAGQAGAGGICINNCKELEELKQFAGSFPCPEGGSVKFSAGNCNAKNSITAKAIAKKCNAGPGFYFDGTLNLKFTVGKGKSTGKITTKKLNLNGFDYAIPKGVNVKLPCSGASTCSGTIKAGGGTCKMTKDCSRCLLK